MNDIECRVIMTLEGERTLADIVHFLHSQQVHEPTNHCVSLYCMFTCITVYHCVLYHYAPTNRCVSLHCMWLFTCDCAVDSIIVLVSRCNENVKLQKERPLDSFLFYLTKVSLINIKLLNSMLPWPSCHTCWIFVDAIDQLQISLIKRVWLWTMETGSNALIDNPPICLKPWIHPRDQHFQRSVGRQYFARLGQTKEKISNPFYRIINMLVVALLGEYWCVGLCNGGCIIIPSLPFSNILQSIPLTLADCVWGHQPWSGANFAQTGISSLPGSLFGDPAMDSLCPAGDKFCRNWNFRFGGNCGNGNCHICSAPGEAG